MPSFDDCIRSAQKQGVLSDDEADALIDRYQEHVEARRAAGEPDAEGGAKTALAGELDEAAARKKLLAGLAEAKHAELRDYLTGYRDINGKPDVFEAAVNLFENYGFGAATSSIAGRSRAITALAHGEMADLLSTFRRSRITGRRFNKPQAENVVREILGEDTGSAEAKGMGATVSKVFEDLRERFNKAGGDIGKIDGGYLPQDHNPQALLKAGYKTWHDSILPKLDLDRMKDPLTGGKLTPERLDATLRVAYDRITTGGWIDREPVATPFGRGSLANQRGEHRFIHFKSADDWLAYNHEFGSGDPLKAIFQHINGMSRDISSMEVLGPNPNSTKEWLKQVLSSEAAKKIAGQPSLFSGSDVGATLADKIPYYGWRLDAISDYVRGRQVVSGRIATGFGNVRNVLTSAQLGGTSLLAAMTDPFIDGATRYLSGLPVTKALWGIAKAFSTQTREQAVRSGLILDDFLHVAGDEARYAGTLSGSEWSKWLADRTVNLNGLEPITQARRHVFALDFQAALADSAGNAMSALPPYLKRTMEDYGITPKMWDKMRATPLHAPEGGAGFLRPIDVAQKDRGAAERYLEMIYGQTERAVPTGTARARSFVTGTSPRGTVMGELLESGLQYKSFSLSFTTLQLQAIKQELNEGAARGAAYASSLFVTLTLGGAMAMQLRHLSQGRDVQPMDSPKFWLGALLTGGGGGVLGDFLFQDMTRFGHSLGTTLAGPTVGLISDALDATVGNLQKTITGKKANIGRDIVNLVGRNTPVASSLFYTRAAYRRMVLDQLQYLVDPDAHKNFREQEQRLKRDTHQGYYWPPGSPTPNRAPDFSVTRQ